jgi:uncharacterized RDD family membrane protein YckC
MDIWIIRDGEKVGPIHDFDVRRKITDGELVATTPAWHEGLPAWKTLIEIDLFTREFDHPTTPLSSEPTSEPEQSTPPPQLPTRTYYGRRFWARWFDLTLYSGVWWIAMWAAGQNIEAALLNPWVMVFQYVPWFILESFLLHRYGTTLGKWLLGLEVVNTDGSRLSISASSHRSLRVLSTGIGFGWSLLSPFCQAVSWFMAKRIGTTTWDHSGGHQVVASPLRPLRVINLVILFFCSIQLQIIVISPSLIQIAGKSYPFLKSEYEKNPPWHLPKRY